MLPEHQGSISQPQLWQGRLYFISDADGNTNIWSVALNGQDLQQHTRQQDWRIGRLSVSDGKAVYQLGADLYQLDLVSNQTQPVKLQLASDRLQQRERWLEQPLRYLTDVTANANTKQAVLTVRSQVVLVGQGNRRTVQIATPTGI